MIETDRIESQCENDDEEEREEVSTNIISQRYNLNENEDEDKIIEEAQTVKDDSEDLVNEQTYMNYELATNIETTSSQDEALYQESFVNESQHENSLQLDSWLRGIKDTIMVWQMIIRDYFIFLISFHIYFSLFQNY